MAQKINSRRKGSSNERSIAKLFKVWTGYDFSKTPQSGGLHWKAKNTIGDIICTDDLHGKRFPFSIEAKFHTEVDFSYLIDTTTGKKSNKILSFWDQASSDAERACKIPLLFIRRNKMKSDTHFVGMPTEYFNSLLWVLEDFKFEYGVLTYLNKDYKITFVNSLDLFNIPYKECYKLAIKINRISKSFKLEKV